MLKLFLSPFFLTVPATECVDTALEKKCEEIKGKGKCHKKWPQKNCQLTCGVCTSSATDSVAGAPSKSVSYMKF